MKRLWIAIALVVSGSAAVAQPHPTVERGFHAEKVYQLGGIESVNIFNGNVLVTPPVGGSYPVSAGLSYRIPLVYNAKIWEYVGLLDNESGVMYTKANLDPRSNAGIGWRLGFGRLKANNSFSSDWSVVEEYEGVDGSIHKLHRTKHPSDLPSLQEPYTWYTRDGSQIRVRKSGSAMLVEFANGEIHEYEYVFGTEWRIVRMRDQFVTSEGDPQNWVEVEYETATEKCVDEVAAWVITDSHGRHHEVCFKDRTADGESRQMVDEVILQGGFGGADERYVFGYITASPGRVRQGNNAWYGDSHYVAAPMLSAITLPDGSKYEMLYWTNLPAPAASAHIKQLTLPTGGKTVWEYQQWQTAHTEVCSAPAWDDSFFTKSSGVHRKKQYDENGSLLGTWEYRPAMETTGTQYACTTGPAGDPLEAYGEIPGEQFTVTVITPDKDKTIHYFSAWPGYNGEVLESAGGFKPSEYGLPFTRRTAVDGRFLSTETFDCIDASTDQCPATPQRRTYVTYEADGTTLHRLDDHHRLKGQRTVYVEDGGKYSDISYDDFDGYGNYRSTLSTGTFGGDVSRATETNYNPGATATGRTSGGARAITSSQPWVLHKHTQSAVKSGTTIFSRTKSCFASNGLLMGRRTLFDPVSDATTDRDVVVLYAYDEYGNLQQEDWFGADTVDASGITNLCLPAAGSTYRRTFGYLAGTLASVDVHARTGTRGSILRLEEYTIDAPTGLVATSTDSSGIVTTYGYGPMRRLTSVTTPGSATVTYEYKKKGDTGYPLAAVVVKTDSSGTANDSQQTIQYDGQGRVTSQTRDMPGGTTATQRTFYDAMGRKLKVSEWQSGTPTKFTELTYDIYNRPVTVTAPDGKVTSTTYTGGGVREVTRTVPVGMAYVGGIVSEDSAMVTETYDVHGRLAKVHDDVSDTLYTYDLADHLIRVQMTGKDKDNVTRTQERLFVYDARGFLDSETHPESGTTDYGDYDARGHATRQLSGATRGIFDLKLEYDEAERLVKVFSREPGTTAELFRIGKQLVYDSGNNHGLSKGKLIEAIRHNYSVALGDVTITDSFDYGSTGADAGRLTKKTTLVERTTAAGTSVYQKLSQETASNDLGLQTTQWYPTCLSAAPCTAAATSSITRSYATGYLKSVAGYLDNVTYHPNGVPHQVTHSGTTQVVDTQLIDSTNGMARPKSIEFGQATACTSPVATAPAGQNVTAGTAVTLSATVGGTGTITVKWYRGTSPDRSNYVGTGSAYTTPVLNATTAYWFEATNSCGIAISETVTVTVTVCNAPALSGPTAVTIGAGNEATLTVDAGTGTFTYAWFLGQTLVGSSQSYNTGALYENTAYLVRVTNSCGSTTDRTVNVTVTCPPPSLLGVHDITVRPGFGTTLTVLVANGLAPLTFEWFRGTTSVGTNSASYATGNLTATTTYRVRVTNRCGEQSERSGTVTVALPPSNLAATSVSSSRIDLAWSAAESATSYEVEWKSGSGAYIKIAVPLAAAWSHQTLAAGTASAYRVRAVHADDTKSIYTNVDIGTTFPFAEALQANTGIDAAHAIELRNAIAGLRVTANLAAYAWTDVPLVVGMPVRAIHLTQLRAALNEARVQLGVPAVAFTDPVITPNVTAVGVLHWNELRAACR